MSAPWVFWPSLAASLLCVARAPRGRPIGLWDALFFLSSWQVFNLGYWQRFLGSYDAAALLLVAFCAAYLVRRGLEVRLTLSGADALRVLGYLAALTLLIPIGLACGFLRLHPIGARAALQEAFGYYVFVAPNEELVFRALVLGLLVRTMRPAVALALSSLLFATIYTHLSGGGHFPNWTYAAFAFVCGLAYGDSYLRTGTLAAPILLHGSVDFLWRAFLS